VSTHSELQALVAQYRAGLEAEMALLRQLAALAAREREVTITGALASLDDISDARDRVMAGLVTVESQLKPVRRLLTQARHQLAGSESFAELTILHNQAAALAAEIVTTDTHSREALHAAERARRFAAEALERGESTLAAYRRVVSPSVAHATLLNRRG
jgi:hypothetical protein